MSDSTTVEETKIEVGGELLTRQQLKERIAQFKAAQDAQTKLIMADREPLDKRKKELEDDLAKIHNARKPELDALDKQKKDILDAIEEESKPSKEELTEVNKDIEELNQDLQEIGVLEKVSRRRGERKAKPETGEPVWKSYVGRPGYEKYVAFFKKNPRIATLQEMKKLIRADPDMGGYGKDGLNEKGDNFSGSANYIWIAVRKMNLVRWNDDGSIEYVGA